MAGVTHDLRNPIATIKMAASDFMPANQSPEDQKENISIILRQIETLDRMVGDLLDRALIESGNLELKPKEVDMGAVEKVKKELLDLRARDIDHKVQGTLEMKKILTEEQINQLTEKIETRRQNFRKGQGHFRKGEFNSDIEPEMPPEE